MRFHTAPMRLKRNSIDNDLQAEMRGEMSPDFRAQRTYSPTLYDADANGLANLSGSWPKVSKRRTSSESMSLKEVSEALAAANIAPAPVDGLGDGLDDAFQLTALDALVSQELKEEAEHSLTCEAFADQFVDAVFGETAAPDDDVCHSRRQSVGEESLFALCLQPEGSEMAQDGLTELNQEELLAMLHLDEPETPSPTSVATLFGAALSSDTSLHGDAATASQEDAFDVAFAQELEGALPPSATKLGMGRNAVERKEWTAAEDEIIRASVLVHGCRWRKIAAQLPGRSDDAVRNRWNRLKAEKAEFGMGGCAEGASGVAAASIPTVSKRASSASSDSSSKPERVSWTKAEDATILQSVHELGHKWNKLAERLPGRTDHAIRNRFHRLQTMLEDKQQQRAQPAQQQRKRLDLLVSNSAFEPELVGPPPMVKTALLPLLSAVS